MCLVFTVAEVQPRHVHSEAYEVPDSLLLRGAGAQSRNYLRSSLHLLRPPSTGIESFAPRVVRGASQSLLYAQELIVLRDALPAGRRPGLYLSGVHRHRKVRDRCVLRLPAPMTDHGRIPGLVCQSHRLERLRERPYLVYLDEDGVAHTLVYAPSEDLRVGHEQVVPDELHPTPQSLRQKRPPLPIVLGQPVLNGENGVFVHHLLTAQGLPLPRKLVGTGLVELRGSGVQGERHLLAQRVTAPLNGLRHQSQRLSIVVQVRREAALVPDTTSQLLLGEQPLETLVNFGDAAQGLLEALETHRGDHELLEVHVVGGMGPTVEYVRARYRQHVSPGATEISKEGQPGRLRRRLGCRDGDTQYGVRPQPFLVLGTVGQDHGHVQRPTIGNVHSQTHRGELIVDVFNGTGYPFAEVTALISVPELYRLILARRGP